MAGKTKDMSQIKQISLADKLKLLVMNAIVSFLSSVFFTTRLRTNVPVSVCFTVGRFFGFLPRLCFISSSVSSLSVV